MNSWALMVALIGEVVVVASLAKWFLIVSSISIGNQKVIALPIRYIDKRTQNGWDVTVCTISVFL
jgi:hypothetical protein